MAGLLLYIVIYYIAYCKTMGLAMLAEYGDERKAQNLLPELKLVQRRLMFRFIEINLYVEYVLEL